jgi:hypothetical protein
MDGIGLLQQNKTQGCRVIEGMSLLGTSRIPERELPEEHALSFAQNTRNPAWLRQPRRVSGNTTFDTTRLNRPFPMPSQRVWGENQHAD